VGDPDDVGHGPARPTDRGVAHVEHAAAERQEAPHRLADRGRSRELLLEGLARLRDGPPGGGQALGELRCRRLDGGGGGVVIAEVSMALIEEEEGGPAVQLVLVDATARHRAEAGMRRMAHHDALTGLPNRLLLLDRLGEALASARGGCAA
jgi:hypothetical protein